MVRSPFFGPTFQFCVGKTWRQLIVHVLPGHTPLLLARPDPGMLWRTMARRRWGSVDVEVKPAFTPIHTQHL